MTRAELDAFLAERGFQVDDARHPHASDSNHFADLYIGTGKPMADLLSLRNELDQLGIDASIGQGNNPGHPAFGKPFVEVKSFWDE